MPSSRNGVGWTISLGAQLACVLSLSMYLANRDRGYFTDGGDLFDVAQLAILVALSLAFPVLLPLLLLSLLLYGAVHVHSTRKRWGSALLTAGLAVLVVAATVAIHLTYWTHQGGFGLTELTFCLGFALAPLLAVVCWKPQ